MTVNSPTLPNRKRYPPLLTRPRQTPTIYRRATRPHSAIGLARREQPCYDYYRH